MDLDSIREAITGTSDETPTDETTPQEAPVQETVAPEPVKDGSDCRVCGKAQVKDGVCQHCGIVQHVN